MSDVWHITNRNEKPTDVPEKGNFIILDGVLCKSGTWYDGEEPVISWENVKRWCYLDELISENERIRKELDVTVDALKAIDTLLSLNNFYIKELPLLNITQTRISRLLKFLNIEQITETKGK